MKERSNGERIRICLASAAAIFSVGGMIYYFSDIHSQVRANTKEIDLRRTNVYAVPLINERLSRIPQIEADIVDIKDSVARIETKMGIPRSNKPSDRFLMKFR